jgi:hypothetical protein
MAMAIWGTIMVATTPIIRTDRQGWALGAVTGLLGLMAVGLALPATLAEMALLSVRPIVEELRQDAVPSASAMAELDAVIDRWEAFTVPARAERIRAMAALARNSTGPEAEAAYRAALTQAPGHYQDWMRLAKISERRYGISQQAAHALRLSILTGPFDLDDTQTRFAMGLRQWFAMDEGDFQAFYRLARTQWQWGPGRFSEIAVRHQALENLRPVFRDVAEGLAEFETRYAVLASGPPR